MEMTQTELDKRLHKNGWDWFLVSTMSPDIVRLQMGQDGNEETMWRKCFEAPNLEKAVEDAEKFIQTISASEYGRQQFGGQADQDTLAFFGY